MKSIEDAEERRKMKEELDELRRKEEEDRAARLEAEAANNSVIETTDNLLKDFQKQE